MGASISPGRQKIQAGRISRQAEYPIQPRATIELYRSTITVPGADSCDCLYCRNFAEQRQTIYPEELKTLLDRLGADPTKEWEA